MMGMGFMKAYRDMETYGEANVARGQPTLEIVNARLDFEPYERLSSFRARRLNLEYCKQELLWYLRADRFDHSIQKYATMWKKLVSEDGGYHSNYGVYLFAEKTREGQSQIDWVVNELSRDPGSRRAVCVLLKPDHLYAKNADVVCTYSMSFRIRDNKLCMTVHMRSNDLIFGTTNDVFCFSCIHEMVFALLKVRYPELTLGGYTHLVDSLHVYSRHFDMLTSLVAEGMTGYERVDMPKIEAGEAVMLTRGRGAQFFKTYDFTRWLTTSKKETE